MTPDYEAFLAAKAPSAPASGMSIVPALSLSLKPFQAALTSWALRRGRAAIFAGTGLGKTIMQLQWARTVANETRGKILLLCPLAVAEQTVAEAIRFDIPGVAYAADQTHVSSDIVVTNYERFEKFDVGQFVGIVLDECFAKGTMIDTSLGVLCIEDIQPGMYIKNAVGIDRVAAVAKREVFGAIKITVGSAGYICSPNHPWLTSMGWVRACDIRSDHLLVATRSAMRLVCQTIPPEITRSGRAAFLRAVLLGEVADEHTGAQGQGSQLGSGGETGALKVPVVQGNTGGSGSCAEVCCLGAHDAIVGENEDNQEGTTYQKQRRQWSSDDGTAAAYAEIPREFVGTRTGNIIRDAHSGISDPLQIGYRQPSASDWGGTGWSQPSESEREGYQKGCEVEFSRVDSVEVLELGCAELDHLRDADGKLYFYDLEGTLHPSFSVGGNLVHNSGIIKSHDGATRKLLTESCQKIPWKLCCTATPAPNDYTELGQHAEFLGVMNAKEMLAMFFVHDGSIRAGDATQGVDGWRMKRHAAQDFWRWLASWSVMVRHPRDLGFDEPDYDLPSLHLHQVTVAAEYKPTAGELFPMMASTLAQRIGVRRDTASDRVAKAVEIVMREPAEPWLIWTNLNAEADMIERLLPRASQVKGSQPTEIKISRLLGFGRGEPLHLVTKAKIAARGMNYQHCARMVMVGLTDSFEDIYQGIRRCWRFGQLRPVQVYFVASEMEGAVVANLKQKESAFETMLDSMAIHMRDLMRETVIGGRNVSKVIIPGQRMELPSWM